MSFLILKLSRILKATPGLLILFFSVFTPYFEEDVMYSKAQLENANVDGITILYYLQTIVPGLWSHLKYFNVEASI